VTPHRIGGRVTATKSASVVSPEFRVLTPYTPNIPRTQVTICGAPKAIAMPNMAAMHQPQEIRFAMAMAPSTMRRMIAIGVSQARILDWRAVAPVRNGEACAKANWGITRHTARRMCPNLARIRNSPQRTITFPNLDARWVVWNHNSRQLRGDRFEQISLKWRNAPTASCFSFLRTPHSNSARRRASKVSPGSQRAQRASLAR
jgi:hypothetical protein